MRLLGPRDGNEFRVRNVDAASAIADVDVDHAVEIIQFAERQLDSDPSERSLPHLRALSRIASTESRYRPTSRPPEASPDPAVASRQQILAAEFQRLLPKVRELATNAAPQLRGDARILEQNLEQILDHSR